MTVTKKLEASSGYFEKQIGHTRYEVHYHFSENGAETVNDKIKRTLRYEIAEQS